MVAGIPRLASVLGPLLTTLRTVTLAGHRVAAATGGWARPVIAIGFGSLALGILAAIQDSAVLGTTGIVLSVVGAYLVTIATWGWSRKLVGAVIATTIGIAILLLSFPLRDEVFGEGACTPKACKPSTVGWFGREALPWINAEWWHVLLVVLPIVMLVALGASLGRRIASARL